MYKNKIYTNIFSYSYFFLHIFRFVLLKERNMLLTMEHECKANFNLFPNPERIDKVILL